MVIDFNNYVSTIEKISYDKDEKEFMLNLQNKVIDFDDFQEAFFKVFNKKPTCSVDGLLKIGEEWYFIEFKNGKIDRKQKKNISEKVGHSLISFLLNVDEKINFAQNKVSLILVYNEEKCRSSGQSLKKDEYQYSPERNITFKKLTGNKRALFQLGRYEAIYFKHVYTYTKEEFTDFIMRNDIPL